MWQHTLTCLAVFAALHHLVLELKRLFLQIGNADFRLLKERLQWRIAIVFSL